MPLRAHLRETASAAAGPYGYTISLSGSVAMASGQLGAPNLLDALSLMGGAVLAFVVVEAVGHTTREEAPDIGRLRFVVANAHLLSAGGALAAAWGVMHVLGGALAWGAVGLVATGVFFAIDAAQHALAAR